MRFSLQRQIILQALEGHTDYPNAQELHKEVLAQIPKLSLGTVYRNLDMLAQNGQIRRIPVPGFAARYTTNMKCKEHLVCPSCGHVRAMPEMEGTMKTALAVKFGEKVDYDLMIYTKCQDCAQH